MDKMIIMNEQTYSSDIKELENVPTNKLKYIMKESPFLRYLIIQTCIVVLLTTISIIIMLLPIAPDIVSQKFNESFIFLIFALIVLMFGILIYMVPLFVWVFQIKKTDERIEFRDEQINRTMIPGMVIFVLGIIINIMAIIRYFV